MADENSLGNFFSATMLVFTALAAALVAFRHRAQETRLWLPWLLATLAIAWLAIDEGAMIHDRLSRSIQENLNTSGIFYFGWTLPYLFLVLIVGSAGLVLLRPLPWRTRRRLIGAAALYVGAALGMEMIESLLFQQSAPDGMTFREVVERGAPPAGWGVLIALEEAGEMIAVALALRSLLLHLREDLGVTCVMFGTRPNETQG